MKAACELQTSVISQEKQEIIKEKQRKTRNLFHCLSNRCRTETTVKPNKPRNLDIVSMMRRMYSKLVVPGQLWYFLIQFLKS